MNRLISSSSPPPLIPFQPKLNYQSKVYCQPKHKIQSKLNYQPKLKIRSSSISMDTEANEIAHDFSPFLRIYKNGAVERLKGTAIAPPSLDPKTQVQSKDVVFSPTQNLSARIYLPPNPNPNKKLPLLVYFHGGGFCVETPYSPIYHTHLNNLVSESNCVAVSVDYRLVPENPLPIGYQDSWAAIEWVASHNLGTEQLTHFEEWLSLYADFDRVYLGGDSAGANIAHRMGIWNGEKGIIGVKIQGIILVHPYFWGKEPIGNEAKEAEKRAVIDAVWHFASPKSENGNDDPWINPLVDLNLGKLGCHKVLVIVAAKDVLRDRGVFYSEKLKESGFGGSVELLEIEDEEHVFHLEKSECENARLMLQKMASFINQ